MKRVLFAIPTMRVGGAEKSLVSLLWALGPDRCQVDLLLFEAGGALQQDVPNWVNVILADVVTRGMTLELRRYWKDLWRAGRPDAALARLWMSASAKLRSVLRLGPGFSWAIARWFIPDLPGEYDVAVGYLEGTTDFYVLDKVRAKRKLGWLHTDMTGRKPALQEHKYYARFDAVGTMSALCCNAFTQLFPQTNGAVQVIENIVLAQKVRSEAQAPLPDNWDASQLHLVTVGRLETAKGIDLAIDACHLLRVQGRPICWHVYGNGSLHAQLEQQICARGLQGRILLEGVAANPYPYMRRATLIVQPSRWEGKSIVLDEAKILGKPIVVTAYPSVADQITHGVTGYVAPITPEGIAAGIAALLDDAALREKLAENCRAEQNRSPASLERFCAMAEI